MKIVIGIFLFFLCFSQIHAQKCNVDSGFRGSRFLIYNEQRHLVKLFKNINELPENVRSRLYLYLNKRLGVKFAKKLKFDEGQYLNLEQLRKEFLKQHEGNVQLGAYALTFHFSDKSNGLKYYFTQLTLGADGSIKEEINLPEIAANPVKAKIISCKTALSIAEKHGFPKEYQSITFEYSSEQDSFIWVVTDNRESKPDDSSSGNNAILILIGHIFNKIAINANDGSVIKNIKIALRFNYVSNF